MEGLRLAFMGSPNFAVPVLQALAAAGHEIACVYSQPPRPAGRGHKARLCPVQAYAQSQGWPVRSPASLKPAAEQAAFAALNLDLAVVVAYGLILPKAVLAAPRFSCLNVHASLLPRWRGAAPIQRAIEAGDRQSGVTIMQMDEGLDTGPMVLREALPLSPETTAQELHDALAALGAKLIVEALAQAARGTLQARPQPATGISYAAKLDKAEGRLDWSRPAVELERRVRAFTPWPGVWCQLGAERLKVSAAQVAEGAGEPGVVLDDRLTVACGQGALRLATVQRAGKAPMPAEAFLRGHPLAPGTKLT